MSGNSLWMTPQTNAAVNSYTNGGTDSAAPSMGSLSSPYMTSPSAYELNGNELLLQVPIGRQAAVAGTTPFQNGQGPVKYVKGTPAGIQTKSLPEFMSNQYQDTPQNIAALQAKLYAGHFYDNSYYSSTGGNNPPVVTGIPDAAFGDALKKAALTAVRSNGNFTVPEVIDQAVQQSQQNNVKNGVQPKLVDPDTFKASIQAAAVGTLGTNIGADLAQKIYDNFENIQQASYTNANGQTTDYSPTGSADYIKQQLQQLMPNTYQAYQNFQGLSSIQNMIGNPVNNLLNPNG